MGVVFIYTSDERNIDFGVENGLWGIPSNRDGSAPKGFGGMVVPGDAVVLMSGLAGQVRRGDSRDPAFDVWADWADQSGMFREIDMVACTVMSGVYRDEIPFWPNESKSSPSKYPWRFEISEPLPLGRVGIAPGTFSTEEAAAIRNSAIIPAPVRLERGSIGLLATVTAASTSPEIGAEHLHGGSPTTGSAGVGAKFRGAGYQRDVERRRAVEQHAVKVVWNALEGDKWKVTSREAENLGYDLECTRGAEVRYVEVKGSSGAGDEVLVSPHEVDFATRNPASAWLSIVGQIDLRREHPAKAEWVSEGGLIVHHGPWTRLPAGLVPTGYRYAHG